MGASAVFTGIEFEMCSCSVISARFSFPAGFAAAIRERHVTRIGFRKLLLTFRQSSACVRRVTRFRSETRRGRWNEKLERKAWIHGRDTSIAGSLFYCEFHEYPENVRSDVCRRVFLASFPRIAISDHYSCQCPSRRSRRKVAKKFRRMFEFVFLSQRLARTREKFAE